MQIIHFDILHILIVFLLGAVDESVLAYFYIIFSRKKKRHAFALASSLTLFNYLLYRFAAWMIPIDNQFYLIAAYAIGSGIGAICVFGLQSKKNKSMIDGINGY